MHNANIRVSIKMDCMKPQFRAAILPAYTTGVSSRALFSYGLKAANDDEKDHWLAVNQN